MKAIFQHNFWAIWWIVMFLLAFTALYFHSSFSENQNKLLPTPVPAVIETFEACVKAGYPVAESYPRQCHVPGGPTFMEEIADDNIVACTLDAKICPDGSSVGRVGPNCEFAPCPGE